MHKRIIHNTTIYLLTALWCALAMSCSGVQLPQEYVTGEAVLTVDEDGIFKQQPAAPGAVREFVFRSEKDRAEFSVGDPVRIHAENIDFGNYTFKTAVTKSTTGRDRVTLTLERILEHTVRLDDMCRTIYWNNPYYTPIIEISTSLNPEQVILTPVFNDHCRRIGYEIRYGSTERGCSKQAKENIRRFQQCVDGMGGGKKGQKENKKNDGTDSVVTSKTPPPRRDSKEPVRPLAEILFGVTG